MRYTINEVRAKLLKIKGLKTKLVASNEEWSKLFLIDDSKVTIGRISFKNNILTSIKSYKKDFIPHFCETDLLFAKIYKVLYFDEVPSDLFLKQLMFDSEKVCSDRFNACLKWRHENPSKIDPRTGKPKRRTPLRGVNPRYIFYKLLLGESSILMESHSLKDCR